MSHWNGNDWTAADLAAQQAKGATAAASRADRRVDDLEKRVARLEALLAVLGLGE